MKSSALCAHLDSVREVTRSPDGCQQCLRIGAWWVHLRECMSCGHVGCCDSSPHRHASKHARETDHPIARSLEAGENWMWCYVDEVFIAFPNLGEGV